MSLDEVIPAAVLADLLDAAGLDEDAVTADYSGRGMYGAVCVGITVADAQRGQLFYGIGYAAAVAESSDERWRDADVCRALLRAACTDSMGLYDVIVYFPGWCR